jgi:hypothetical protein
MADATKAEPAAAGNHTTDVSGVYEQHIFNLVKENNAHLIALRKELGEMHFSMRVRFIITLIVILLPFVGAYLVLPEVVDSIVDVILQQAQVL